MQNAVAGTSMTTVDTKHGELVDAEGHICAFFHSVDEEYQVLLPVMREGFDRGERIFYIVDPDLRGDHLARLSAGGIDVVGGEAGGQLVMLDWSQTYLSTGRLDEERFMSQFTTAQAEGRTRGYPRTRFVSHMEWALKATSINSPHMRSEPTLYRSNPTSASAPTNLSIGAGDCW
jgi:hypothetical protein